MDLHTFTFSDLEMTTFDLYKNDRDLLVTKVDPHT